MILSMIAAVLLDNYGIGKQGGLLYRVSADLARFKEITMGKPIIMGRKTYESLPVHPLPGRREIIISRDPNYPAPEVYTSLDDALEVLKEEPEVIVIGGEQIYREAYPKADRLYMTEFSNEYPIRDADAFFPSTYRNDFKLVEATDIFTEGHNLRFATYEKM